MEFLSTQIIHTTNKSDDKFILLLDRHYIKGLENLQVSITFAAHRADLVGASSI
jgi:hypothetical protein